MNFNTTTKLLHLEGLRGFACAIVAVSHYLLAFYPAFYFGRETQNQPIELPTLVLTSPIHFLYNGNFAVMIFFMLSGYVLSIHYFSKPTLRNPISASVKRYFRLTIPVLMSMIFVYFLLQNSFIYNQELALFTKSKWLIKMNLNCPTFFETLKMGLFDVYKYGDNSLNTVLWTLRLEFICSYIVFMILIVDYYFSKTTLYLYIIICFLLLYFSKFYYLTFLFGSFMANVQFRFNYQKHLQLSNYQYIILLICVILIAAIPDGATIDFPIYSKYIGYQNSKFQLLYQLFASAILLYIVLFSENIKAFFQKPIFVYLGKISFSMYLLHVPIIFSLVAGFYLCFVGSVNEIALQISCVLIFVFSTWGFSHVFMKFIDKNATIFSNKIFIFIENIYYKNM